MLGKDRVNTGSTKNKRALYVGVFLLVSTSTTLSAFNLISPIRVGAVFDPEMIERAKKDFPDETPSPSPSVSMSASPTPPTTTKPNSNDIGAFDRTPWLLGGGTVLLLTLLTFFILRLKKE